MLFGGIIIILFEVIAWIKELEKGFFDQSVWLVAYDYYKEEKTSNNEKAFYHKFCRFFSAFCCAFLFLFVSEEGTFMVVLTHMCAKALKE